MDGEHTEEKEQALDMIGGGIFWTLFNLRVPKVMKNSWQSETLYFSHEGLRAMMLVQRKHKN